LRDKGHQRIHQLAAGLFASGEKNPYQFSHSQSDNRE
jgi:hypothetical protein